MTIKREHEIGGPEGGIVKCFSCIAHGRILLELISRPHRLVDRLEALAAAHDVYTKFQHDIRIIYRSQPKAE